MEMMQTENVAKPWGYLYIQKGAGNKYLYKDSYSIGKRDNHDWIITAEDTKTQYIFDRLSRDQCVISKNCSNEENPVFIKNLSSNGTYVNKEKIDNERILKTGDVISFNRQNFEFFKFVNCHEEQYDVPKNIFREYHIGKVLGTGGQGAVRIITDRKTCEEKAMKIVKRKRCRSFVSEDKQMREVNIMKDFEQHENIIKYYKHQKDKDYIYIFLEYMKGGDLLNRIKRNKYLPVNTAKHLFLQLCRAVEYMHNTGSIHRDIKPENILLQSENELTDLKLCDFGLSRKVSNELYTLCGSPSYMAPEIHKGSRKYSFKVDVWSLGVVLYVMLAGKLPFGNVQQTQYFQNILSGNYDLDSLELLNVQDSAKDLIRKMLTVDENQRPTVKEVLNHSWLRSSDSDTVNNLIENFNPEIGQPSSKRRRME